MDEQTTAYVKRQIDEEYARYERRDAPPNGFRPFPDIPAGRYLSDEFFELEQTHIWSKSWLLAAHTDEIPSVGDYLLWERAGVPILIARGRDQRIRAFYNTCAHRGGPLVRQDSGNEKLFVCKYHCWAYGLDGALTHVPDQHEFVAIDKATHGLRSIRCETFGNWIFVNRDSSAASLMAHLGPVAVEWEDFEPAKLRLVTKYCYDLAANWKIMMDAFQEVYHLKHIHPQTVDKALDHRGATMALLPNGNSRMVVPYRTGMSRFVTRAPSHPIEDRPSQEIVRSASVAYNLFPNIVTPTGPVSFPFLVFWPVSRSRTILEVSFYTRGDDRDKDGPAWRERIDSFNRILDEDNENLPWIQRSIESGAIDGIPLSYQERRIYHFHEHVDRVIGIDNVPERLRVQPWCREMQEDGKGQRV